MIPKSKLVFLFILLTTITSCFKDSEELSEVIITPNPKIIIESAQLVVKVTNENGEEVTGISADFNNEIKVVDNSSIFFFSTKKISKEDEILTITDKDGESFHYKIYSIENEVNYHEVCVFKNYGAETINSNLNKTINFSTGQSIQLTNDNYLQGQNNYSGNVIIKYHGYDLQNAFHRKAIPGGHTLIDKGVRKMIDYKEVFRFDAYDTDKKNINFKTPVKINLIKNVKATDVILFYNSAQRDWEITNIIPDQNSIHILKSGIYAVAELNDVAIVKGRITFNSKDAKNENLLLEYADQKRNIATTNSGKWECLVPIDKTIKINLQHECISSPSKTIISSNKINDSGIIDFISNNVETVSIKANLKNCNDQALNNAILIIETQNMRNHLLVTDALLNIEQNICSGDKAKLTIIGNDIQGKTFNIIENSIDLDNYILCSQASDEYLLIRDDQGNKILYNQLESTVNANNITIDYSKNDEQKLNLKFNHNNVPGQINPILSNLVWHDNTFGNQGIVFNCPSSNDCGFNMMQLTYINNSNEYIRGKFAGRFWIKTTNPVTASYKNIEAEFQVRR